MDENLDDIFKQEVLVDANNQSHQIFIDYYFQGTQYFITSDSKVFYKVGESYNQASPEISAKIFDILNNLGNRDVIKFDDKGDERGE